MTWWISDICQAKIPVVAKFVKNSDRKHVQSFSVLLRTAKAKRLQSYRIMCIKNSENWLLSVKKDWKHFEMIQQSLYPICC